MYHKNSGVNINFIHFVENNIKHTFFMEFFSEKYFYVQLFIIFFEIRKLNPYTTNWSLLSPKQVARPWREILRSYFFFFEPHE